MLSGRWVTAVRGLRGHLGDTALCLSPPRFGDPNAYVGQRTAPYCLRMRVRFDWQQPAVRGSRGRTPRADSGKRVHFYAVSAATSAAQLFASSALSLMPMSMRRSMAKSPNSIKIRLKVASRGVSHR